MNYVHKERVAARRVAVQLLYTAELTQSDAYDIAVRGDVPSDIGVISDYALLLLKGVRDNNDEIIADLAAASENWTIDRMPIVDRCILRMAIFEMRYVDDVPVSVSIDEAVELAKDFGGEDDSHRFINGILGKIARGDAGEYAAETPDED